MCSDNFFLKHALPEAAFDAELGNWGVWYRLGCLPVYLEQPSSFNSSSIHHAL